MSNPYAAFCEDFYVNMRLGSQLSLPHSRDTLLHLFERVQKTYPSMTRFRKSDSGEFNLEEDRSSHSYRWMSVESKRLSSGHVNPDSVEESLKVHQLLLEMAPCHLGLSPIEIDYLDVLFGFDLGFGGNHDEIIAESLFPECHFSMKSNRWVAEPNLVTFDVHWKRAKNIALSLRGNPEEFQHSELLAIKPGMGGYSECTITHVGQLAAAASYVSRAAEIRRRGRNRTPKRPVTSEKNI